MQPAPAALWEGLEGTSIDNKYHLQKLIGVGGSGAVFQGSQVIKDEVMRQVAVKLIPSDPGTAKQQLLELTSALNLHHDHLIRGFDAGLYELRKGREFLYLTMELATSGLDERLRRGVMTTQEARRLAEAVASVLAYLHERDLVHRDVKPGNMLIVEDPPGRNTWKLADLGIVRARGQTSTIMGTDVYVPPEAYLKDVTPAGDLWALGVMLVEVLTGHPPFEWAHSDEVQSVVMLQDPRIPPELDPDLSAIVRGCLIKNPKDRWTATRVLARLRLATSQPQTQAFAGGASGVLSRFVGLFVETGPTPTIVDRQSKTQERLARKLLGYFLERK